MRTLPSFPTRSVGLAAIVATICVMTVASTALGATFGPTKVLRTAAVDTDLIGVDVEGEGHRVAVTWLELRNNGAFAFIRLSEDGGQTFEGKKPLTGSGSLDICDDRAWSVTRASSGRIWVDGIPFGGAPAVSEAFSGPTGDESGIFTEIACVGDRRLAATWFDTSVSPAHVEVMIRPFPGCVPCAGLPSYAFDLGTEDIVDGGRLFVAATNRHVYVAWLKNNQMKFKHFSVGLDADATVTPHPTVTLFNVSGQARFSQLAADRSKVVLAYQDPNDTKIRVSTNNGASFGDEIVVDEATGGVSEPTSIDLIGQHILVGIFRRNWPTGPIYQGLGMLSTDLGETWSVTSEHAQAQGGALFRSEGVMRIAEIWDQYWSNTPSPKLRFHVGTV